MPSTAALPTWTARRPWLLAALAAAGGAALWIAGPAATTGPVVCPFRLLTGWDCPLCGATRATAALVHGHLAGAVGYNALYAALLPVALWAWVLDARGRYEGSHHPFRRRAFWFAAAAIAVAFTVVRNLPGPLGRALHS